MSEVDLKIQQFVAKIREKQVRNLEEALMYAWEFFNELGYLKQFKLMQEVLDKLCVTDLDGSVLVVLCTQAWNAQRDGIIYEPFRKRCELELLQNNTKEDVENIFQGLTGLPSGCTTGDILRVYGGRQDVY